MSAPQLIISAPAALRETTELVQYYRNRNLILAEHLAQAEGRIAALNKELDEAKQATGDRIAALEAELAAAKVAADPPEDAPTVVGEDN